MSKVTACNEDVQAANDSVSAGSFSVADGGAQVVPFGQYVQTVILHPKDAARARGLGHVVSERGEVRALQLVDAQAANDLAADLRSIISRALRGFKAVPIYNGHPYHPDPERAKLYQDRRAYGWVKEITSDAQALRFDVDYTTLGTQAVNEGWFAFHSPQWDMRIVDITKEGVFCRPYRLRSGGLTNEPNIPVPPMVAANESESEPTAPHHPMKTETLAKLKKLFKLSDDADDAALDQAANEYCDKALADADKGTSDLPKDDKKKDEEDPAAIAAAAAAAANDQIQLAVTAANDQVKALRGDRITFAVDQLVLTGRVPLAKVKETTELLTACANDAALDTELTKLRGVKPALQTSAQIATTALAAQKGEALAANEAESRKRLRDEAVADALNGICKGREPTPENRQAAWTVAQKKNPTLFAS
ncbi:MAG: phage protease [Verrucomicrobiota bacterium]